jgi:hypothetical protein
MTAWEILLATLFNSVAKHWYFSFHFLPDFFYFFLRLPMDPKEALENRNRSADAYLVTGEQKLFELRCDQKKTSSYDVS